MCLFNCEDATPGVLIQVLFYLCFFKYNTLTHVVHLLTKTCLLKFSTQHSILINVLSAAGDPFGEGDAKGTGASGGGCKEQSTSTVQTTRGFLLSYMCVLHVCLVVWDWNTCISYQFYVCQLYMCPVFFCVEVVYILVWQRGVVSFTCVIPLLVS